MPGPREVDFIETVTVDGLDDVPATEEETEEVESEEKETPAGSSPENEPIEPEPEVTPELEPATKESPKESPIERARLLEIERLKRQLQRERGKKLFGDEQPQPTEAPKLSAARLEKLKEKYSEDDLSSLQEVFSSFAEDMGFVKKDQLYKTSFQQSATDVLDTFIEQHPEYQPENDPDNVLWGQFQEEVKMFRNPENPKEYRKIFERVHQRIFGVQSSDKLLTVEARKETVKAASHAASPRPDSSTKSRIERASVDPAIARPFMHGFSEEDLKEIGL